MEWYSPGLQVVSTMTNMSSQCKIQPIIAPAVGPGSWQWYQVPCYLQGLDLTMIPIALLWNERAQLQANHLSRCPYCSCKISHCRGDNQCSDTFMMAYTEMTAVFHPSLNYQWVIKQPHIKLNSKQDPGYHADPLDNSALTSAHVVPKLH